MSEGDCFRTAANSLMDGVILGKLPESSILVHGRPTLQREPWTKFTHAWIEMPDGIVIDNETGFRGPAPFYYGLGNIDPEECFTYTFEEMKKHLIEYGHYGPWEGPEACPPVESEDEDGT